MNDDYLWDRTGEPDAELAQLEQVLGTLRWRKTRDGERFAGQVRQRRRMAWWAAAAAAMVLVGLGAAAWLRQTQPARAFTAWQLSVSGSTPQRMRAGQLVEIPRGAQGSIESERVGRVDIEPDSRLRLLTGRESEQRLSLDRGTIHALIWAPPARFIVDTPAARAVDLGCAYTLRVGGDGAGLLTVEMGWVAFQWKGIESFIPAGAACTTRPGHGPDTPYFLDAPNALRNAIAEFDRHRDQLALHTALAAARPRDGLTLWHLLQRTQGEERAEVFDRLAGLVKVPSGVTREAIVRGDRGAFDASWNALNLGNTGWWREWKRQW